MSPAGFTLQATDGEFPQRHFPSGSGTRMPEEMLTITFCRGTVGRKVFNKEWANVEPRYPINIHERFHRSAVRRIFHPSIVENVGVNEEGPHDSFEWRMSFEDVEL